MLAPLISRFFLVQIQPELGDWKDWAMRNGVVEEVVSYQPNTRTARTSTGRPMRWSGRRSRAAGRRPASCSAGYNMDTLTPLLAGCVGAGLRDRAAGAHQAPVDMVPADVILAGRRPRQFHAT